MIRFPLKALALVLAVPALQAEENRGITTLRDELRHSVAEHNAENAEKLSGDRLVVADVDMGLEYQDPTVTVEIKQFIVKDLHHVFGHLTGHRRYQKNDGGYYLYFTGKGRRIPKVLSKTFGEIVNRDGEARLVVGKDLTDVYRVAFELEEEGIIQGLRDLLDAVKNVDTGDDFSLGDFFVFDEEAVASSEFRATGIEGAPDELKKRFLSEWKAMPLRMPSVLEIGTCETEFQGLVGKGEWASQVYVEANGIPLSLEWPVVTDRGRWKIYIYTPGT